MKIAISILIAALFLLLFSPILSFELGKESVFYLGLSFLFLIIILNVLILIKTKEIDKQTALIGVSSIVLSIPFAILSFIKFNYCLSFLGCFESMFFPLTIPFIVSFLSFNLIFIYYIKSKNITYTKTFFVILAPLLFFPLSLLFTYFYISNLIG